MGQWHRGSAEVVSSRTLKVTLPDGIKVHVGRPVPPEILEMMAAYLRLQNGHALESAEGCGVQLGMSAEGCGLQLGQRNEVPEGCLLQFAAGSNVGSGNATRESKTADVFHSVKLLGRGTLRVDVSGPQSIAVAFDDNLQRLIRCVTKNGILEIGTTEQFTSQVGPKISVSVPRLTGIELAGQGAVEVVQLSGDAVTVELSGNGTIAMSGRVRQLNAIISGAGEVRCFGLDARLADVALQGQGQIAVTATESLKASIVGTGQIYYRGNPPSLTKSITGFGSISSD